MISNKIALEALKLAGFKNPTAIAEILNYVPNSNAALEMLLGIHEPQQRDFDTRFRVYKWKGDNDKFIEITDINDLANTISYTEFKQNTQNVYYLTKEDRDNKVYQVERPKGDYYSNGSIPAKGYSETKNSMSLVDFEGNYATVLKAEDAYTLLQDWVEYGNPPVYHYEDVFGAPVIEPIKL